MMLAPRRSLDAVSTSTGPFRPTHERWSNNGVCLLRFGGRPHRGELRPFDDTEFSTLSWNG
jgi:hypothetical protein